MCSSELLQQALEYLKIGVWHSTSRERFSSIKNDGIIRVEPSLAKSERWKAQDANYYPYVRKIGGVSLFVLNDFNPEVYSNACPMSSWQTFIPFRKNWGASVWIKVRPDQLGEKFIKPSALWERQDHEKAWRHTLMPRIEGALLGDIKLEQCDMALDISEDGIREISLSN